MIKRFLKPEEAGEYLSISPKTIYALAARGEIPAVKVGGSIRIDRKKLDENLDAQINLQEERLKRIMGDIL